MVKSNSSRAWLQASTTAGVRTASGWTPSWAAGNSQPLDHLNDFERRPFDAEFPARPEHYSDLQGFELVHDESESDTGRCEKNAGDIDALARHSIAQGANGRKSRRNDRRAMRYRTPLVLNGERQENAWVSWQGSHFKSAHGQGTESSAPIIVSASNTQPPQVPPLTRCMAAQSRVSSGS